MRIVQWVSGNRARFHKLMRVFLSFESTLASRASWPISVIVSQTPGLLIPYLGAYLKVAATPNAPVAVKRNAMRSLQFLTIPRAHQSAVANLAMGFFRNRREAIAVRVFSMTVLGKLCSQYPDLKNELIPLLEDELPTGTPAFRSRGRKILRSLTTHLGAL
jgi:hypothetical protein